MPLIGVVPAAHATSTIELSTSNGTTTCPAINGTWTANGNTCTLPSYPPDKLDTGTTLQIDNDVTLAISCTGLCSGFTDYGNIANFGTIAISNSGTFSAGLVMFEKGNITNSGSINVANSGGYGLENDGTGRISNSGNITISTTDGRGGITSFGAIDNSGQVIISNSGSTTGISSEGLFSNSGMVKVSNSGAGSTGIDDTAGAGSAPSIVNSGSITVSNTGSSSIGILNNRVSLSDSGSITVSNTGSSSIGIFNAGTISVSGTLSVSSPGTILNDYTITVSSTGSIENGGTFNNRDYLTISNSGTGSVGLNNTGYLSNTNELTVSNNGGTGILDSGKLDNSESLIIENSGGTGVHVESGGNLTSSLQTTVANTGSGSTGISNSGNVTNSGKISVSNTGSGTTGIQNAGKITNTATGLVSNTGSIYNSKTVSNSGTIVNYCGSVFEDTSGGTVAGTPIVNECYSSTTAVTPNPTTATPGGSVTFTATTTSSTDATEISGGIVWSDNGAGGTFSTSGCSGLSGSSSISCTVSYTAPSATGSVTISAKYSGDYENTGSSGNSSLAVKDSPTISTSLSLNEVDAGQPVYDSATLSGATGAAGGTVAYEYFASGTCMGSPTTVGSAVGVTNGGVPDSASRSFSSPGTYGWDAVYSGDANNSNATSACEPLTVSADPTVSVSPAGPLSYDQGQSAAALTASVTYGGLNTASVEWYSSSTPFCSGSSADTGASGGSFTPPTTSTGTTYYCAVVSDSGVLGYQSASSAVLFRVDPALLLQAPDATHNPADVGQSVNFTASPTGGSGLYTEYHWSDLPTGCSSSNSATITCSPSTTTGSPFSVVAAVTDSNGNTVTSSALSFTVDPALSAGTLASSAGDTLVIGQQTTLSTSGATGGSGTYDYAWAGLPPGCVGSDSASISCTPSDASGSPFTVTLTVADANGNSDNATLTLTVLTPQQAVQSLSATLNGMNLQQGITQSLGSKLNAAVSSLNSGNTNAAINQLNAFIHEVNAQSGKKITQAQAQLLTTQAQTIIESL